VVQGIFKTIRSNGTIKKFTLIIKFHIVNLA
jgi:hypothetical protein